MVATSSSSTLNLVISHNKSNSVSLGSTSLLYNNTLLYFLPSSIFFSSKVALRLLSNNKLSICAVAKTVPSQIELDQQSTCLSPSFPNASWAEFADKVSGEWDGFGADFTPQGTPIELPESVVPQAYREWEVKVYDWQTQCPTLADPQNFHLSYRSVKLLPTVGCEADAATIYSTDERIIGFEERERILAFAFQSTGCYVVLWLVEEREGYKVLELECSLIDPRDKESRVRVVKKLRLEGSELKLLNIRVFCELWYGPFRNGDQLGGCVIRDPPFASTPVLNVSEVVGVWQSRGAQASFLSSKNNVLEEHVTSTKKIVRTEEELIMLPRQLWCSLEKVENGETCGEVGWLLDPGFAITSTCIFSSDGNLKEIAIGHETAAGN